MILKLEFTPTVEDFLDFQKFRLKQTKIANIYYFLFAFMFAGAIYFAITSKDFTYLISTAILAVAFVIIYFYDRNIKVKKEAQKFQKIDSSYLSKNEMTLYHNAIEINSVKEEGMPVIDTVYPFSTFRAVFETDKAYYLVLADAQIRFIPKRDMSEENIKIISDTLMKIPNYKFVK